jgi:hypothetical protein
MQTIIGGTDREVRGLEVRSTNTFEDDKTMTSAIVMERAGMGMPGMGHAATGPMGTTAGMPSAPQWMMVPRCKIKMEKCAGGMKMTCKCDDATSATMLQNLCAMMTGGMCSCCAMMNGMMMCCCNLAMGMCKCEPTKDGVCITCTSGDPSCCAMIQASCECMTAMTQAGCVCCICMNNMPVCCSC